MKKFIKIFVVLIFFVVLVSPFVFLYKLKINIYCFSDYFVCNKKTLSIIEDNNKNLFSFFKIYRELKINNNLRIKQIGFLKNGVFIKIDEAKGFIAFYNNEQYEIVDKNGNFVLSESYSALPVVFNNNDSLVIEQKKYIVNMGLYLSQNYDIKLLEVDNLKFTVVFSDLFTAYFSLEGNYKRDLGALSLVYSWLNKNESQARIENKSENTIIDFRTKNPIVLNY